MSIDSLYTTEQILSRGRFGCVYLCKEKSTKMVVVIKTITKSSQSACEVDIMRNVFHKNIVGCFKCLNDRNNFYIIMEKCEKTLDDYLESYAERSIEKRETNGKIILSQVRDGLQYLKSKQIFHGDLKPTNILLKKDGTLFRTNNIAKICDFGASFKYTPELIDKDNFFKRAPSVYTNQYAAPKILSDKKIHITSDVWSLMFIIMEFVSGKKTNPRGIAFTQITYTYANESTSFRRMIGDLMHIIVAKRILPEHFFVHEWFDKN